MSSPMGSVHAARLENGAVGAGPVQVPGWVGRLLWRHRVRLHMGTNGLRTTSGPTVAVSGGVRDDLRRLYEVPFERMHVVLGGFDLARCCPRRKLGLRAKMRQDVGLAEEDVALLTANEHHHKGLGVLLNAMAVARHPRLPSILRGGMAPLAYPPTGPGEPSPLLRTTWPSSTQQQTYLPPTQHETFGSVVMEALASGLPVIASKLAGAADVILDRRNGLLLRDPLGATELPGLLKKGLDPAARREMSERAPSSVAGFDWSAVMSRFEKRPGRAMGAPRCHLSPLARRDIARTKMRLLS